MLQPVNRIPFWHPIRSPNSTIVRATQPIRWILAGLLFLSQLLMGQLLAHALWGHASAIGGEVLQVKIVVDEEEATRPEVWKARLGNRVMSASAILSRYTDVRLAILSFATWDSDDRIQDFSKSLSELQQEVKPDPAQIVIAFSSQYKFQPGRNNLGGTRGPLSPYILIRENARSVLEPERLEVLVHELGHFLGAAHSGRPDSVMRPVVGDGQARARAYQISFDPHNAEIIRLVGGQLRNARLRDFRRMSPEVLRQLRPHYAALQQEAPADPAAGHFLQMVDALLTMSH